MLISHALGSDSSQSCQLGSDALVGLLCVPSGCGCGWSPKQCAHSFKGFDDFPVFIVYHWYLTMCCIQKSDVPPKGPAHS